MNDFLLVSSGAILGANTRFVMYKKFEKLTLRKDVITLLVNIIASFFFGFFLSVLPNINPVKFSYQLALFFLFGFLGSFSTFSTYIFDLFELCLQFKFIQAFKLFFISCALGIASLVFGFVLGN